MGEDVKSVLVLNGVSGVDGELDSGDEIESRGLLPVLALRNRQSESIRARDESRPFPTLSLTLLVSSRKSGVLLLSPRNSRGRRRRAPSKLVDRLRRKRNPFALLNRGNIAVLSKYGTSMTGSSFDMTFVDGVRCGIGDGGSVHDSNGDRVRGMGDEMEDGKATVEISVRV